ncbi:MAG: hypothetical protein OEM27_06145 [Nitrospinota bacterium]|nr:hypothetical protein [Nitrospinota bacterium]
MNQSVHQRKDSQTGKRAEDLSVPATVADNQAVGGENQPEFGWKEHHRPKWALHSPIQDVFCRYGGYYS